MPLITATTLTTIGVSLITGAINCLKEDTLSKATLEVFNSLFSTVLGNAFQEKYNLYQNKLTELTVPEHNADVERCSRHALLKALIIFSEAAKEQLSQTELTSKERDDCRHFLIEAQKYLTKKLEKLATLDDNDTVLQKNPLTQENRLTLTIAKSGSKEQIDAMKTSLADIALSEFNYPSGNLLHKQLLTWLPEGLPNGRHWFVYYIHELHANLKKDEPSYCRNARYILTQTKLAEISLMSSETLNKLGNLMPLTSEIKELLDKYLIKISEDTTIIREGIKVLLEDMKFIIALLKEQNSPTKLPEIIQNVDKEAFKNAKSIYYDAEIKYIDSESEITKHNLSEKITEHYKVCIVGEPGMGKSFLARQVVHNVYLAEQQKTGSRKYDIIWWIDADTNKVENELIELAREVCGKKNVAEWLAKAGTGDAIGNAGVIKELFYELKNRSWLIVFDNAMDTDTATGFGRDLITLGEYAKKYLPETTTKGHLLLTSRNKSWAIRSKIQYPFQPLYLEKWTDESVRVYLEKPENPKKKITVNSLDQVRIFQGLPLAVSIAKARMLDINNPDRFSIFYQAWHEGFKKIKDFKKIEEEDYDIDRNLLTTIDVSYQHLSADIKHFINVLVCFAPDDLPVLSLYEANADTKDSLGYIERLSLGRYDEADDKKLYSMHRLVQECIKQLQAKNDTLNASYRKAISLLSRRFNAVFGKDNTLIGLLLSHADTLADAIRTEQNSFSMSESEKNEAAQLFLNAGQYHFDVGENKRSIEQFQSALNTTKDEALTAKAKKSFANVLFLLGRGHFDDAETYARAAAASFKKLRNKADYIDCQNDVLGKILQRKCEFEKCEKITLSTNKLVKDYIRDNVGDGDVFEHIVEKYVQNKDDKIAEKQGSVYHNLGSLYWTWGRPGNGEKNDGNTDISDYERARSYFFKAIDFQEKMVAALKGAAYRFSDKDISDKLNVAAGRKKFFLNVSRMIYGAVLGLLKEYDGDQGQWRQHQEAFADFEGRAFEKRRYAYTAYYMLAYSWDRKALFNELPDKFNENNLIKEVLRYDNVLGGNDEKFDLIKKIINLREAVKNPKRQHLAEGFYYDLRTQLEAMKYKFNRGKQQVIRYYDVDTCSVSAILDYADFLSKGEKVDEAKAVAEFGLDVTKGIEYPRINELKALAAKNRLSDGNLSS